MKKIFQRNKIIVYFGLGLAILFIVVIFFGEQEGGLTRLADIIVKEEEPATEEPVEEIHIPQEEPQDIPPPIKIEDEKTKAKEKLSTTVEEKINALPPIVFTFTEEGFIPRSDEAVKGQRAIWVNNTDKQITIQELIKKHEEFAEGIVIEPNGLYEMTLYGTQFWTFKELESGSIGRILIYDQERE